MTEETTLLEKREELKRQLAAGAYKTEIMVWADRTGHLIQKLTGRPAPPSDWFSMFVLVTGPVLILFPISLLMVDLQQAAGREFLLSGLSLYAAVLFISEGYLLGFAVFFKTLRKHLLDSITSIADLAHLQQTLKSLKSGTAILFGLAYSLMTVGLFIYFFFLPRLGFFSLGGTIYTAINSWGIGIATYNVFQFLFWLIALGRYQLKLYPSDPRNSEIIDRLSGMIYKGLYIMAIMGIVVTLLFTAFGLTTLVWIIFLLVLVWAPIIGLFIVGQISLSNIIANAKWKELNEVQAKVEKLKAEENIEDKDTMETIKRLIEYHNQILGTRDSSLNLRAGLNFLTSLILPILALVLANLDKILALFQAE